MGMVSQLLLPGDEASAYRGGRQPQAAHLRCARHALCSETLKACGAGGKKQIAALENLYRTLDPFALKETIEIKLRAVLRYQIRTPFFKAA